MTTKERVFDRFYTTGATGAGQVGDADAHRGHGIGLALTRPIVEATAVASRSSARSGW